MKEALVDGVEERACSLALTTNTACGGLGRSRRWDNSGGLESPVVKKTFSRILFHTLKNVLLAVDDCTSSDDCLWSIRVGGGGVHSACRSDRVVNDCAADWILAEISK